MTRLASISIGVVVVAALMLVPAGGTPAAAAPGSAKCEYKWKKKRIVKNVKRHGRKKRIVRIRKYRVCVPVTPEAPSRLGVKAFEFGFTLSRKTLRAGDTIVELSNRGEDAHDLHIKDLAGGPEILVPETAPLSYSRVRFETEPGGYRLWCSLPGHAALGMDATFAATD